MDAIRSYFTGHYTRHPAVVSAVMVNPGESNNQWIDGFDILMLVITELKQPTNHTSHYSKDNYRIQERWIHKDGLESWVLNGENRNIIQWILQGELIVDQNGYLGSMRQALSSFPMELREKKMLIEFTHFLRRYMQSKEYLANGEVFDAYSNILEALHHWARIVIIQNGAHPEVTVWNQVHQINPGVYKLYEELLFSAETLEQRVKLVQLAAEFSVLTKMRECCAFLLRVISSRQEPWSASELKEHVELGELHIDLSLVLRKLTKRSVIKEVMESTDGDLSIMEVKYTL
ncbi:hypothetical protein DUZ99_01455 [Xylanibacillus composti]|uniref:Nucleotidyltransferase-like domain-containing protein n=1 Tax=Xylanibacillus composti TaxID=1572762 RepID=A0A8J4M4D0_9BACL|nr:nucleotidyltransferase-like protein [Xylanibacillus composti]MDT9723664.1 hypothetical protein [Xylanibacillus composti]GIQ71000.1 hypothetical protein XYCOK13_38240 [Xylanibacillus composti]